MRDLAGHWGLDPDVEFLNHGSFGACPRPVLEEQARLREEMEREPVDFFVRRLPARIDAVRERLARFVGSDFENLVPLPNVTTGINAVLRSVVAQPGEEWLVTDHEYNASRNALEVAAAAKGARVVAARLPWPVTGPDEVVGAILECVTPRTRLALIDHVTSQTAVVFPIERLTRELAARGVDVLVDGAHAPGMVSLDVAALDASYYVGHCHKWLCAPKGAAFLHVRADRRDHVRPPVISHGANTRRSGRSRFHDEFDWIGTDDPTAFLCVPTALDFMSSLVAGGWPEIRLRNHRLVCRARQVLAAALEVPEPCPETMLGSLASLPLPDGSTEAPSSALYTDELQERLRKQGFEVPVVAWPAPPRRLLRISAQLYNDLEQYERLAVALRPSESY